MFAVEHAAHSGVVTTPNDDSDRGAEIRRRYEKLGISYREWDKQTGIARQTLLRAFENAPGTRESTYLAIESELTRLEDAIAGRGQLDVQPISDPDRGLVTFTVEGIYGAKSVVIKGPVENVDLLREQIDKLLRGAGVEDESANEESP